MRFEMLIVDNFPLESEHSRGVIFEIGVANLLNPGDGLV
jgi:hypothetical protein